MAAVNGADGRPAGEKAYSFIKRPSEYRLVYDSGKKLVGRYYVLFAMPSRTGTARVGVTVSGKVGGAVVRNRAKRRTREALRMALVTPPELDMVFVALGRITGAPFEGLVKDIARLVRGVS